MQNPHPDYALEHHPDSLPAPVSRAGGAPHRSRKGFTLIELLVVMAIILILMGLVVGISGAAQRRAAESKAKAQISNLMLEFDKFRADRGSYPANIGDSRNFRVFLDWYEDYYPVDYDVTERNGDNLLDPWREPYEFVRPNPNIVIIRSSGPSRDFEVDDNIRSDRL